VTPVDVMFSGGGRRGAAERERAAIERALQSAGSRSHAAELLGMTPIALERRMTRLGMR
jgi:transcriptional regulator with GAF, ATPase, and Fis domain